MKTSEIAALLAGELLGDGDRDLIGGQTLERARECHLAFWERRPGQRGFPGTNAGCVVVDQDTVADGRTIIRVPHPRTAFARALRALAPQARPAPGIHATAQIAAQAQVGRDVSVGPFAVIAAGARIGDGVSVGPHAYVGAGAVVGADCVLHAGARVHGNARLGQRVVLHSGAVVGSDGFGLVFEADHYERFPQLGGVEIGDDVEIGANSCVDRGALDATRIGRGTKLDNLVHIGHNCQIGQHVVMAAQVGLSGGVRVGDYAVLGGQVGIGDRAQVGAGAKLGGQGGLLPDKELAPGGAYWGTPARPLRDQLARQALVNRLPKLIAELRRLRARVAALDRS